MTSVGGRCPRSSPIIALGSTGDRIRNPLRRQELDRVTGTHAANGMNLKVFLDGIQLKAQMGGQPPVFIFAESPDTFFLTVVDATLAFAAGKDGAPAVMLSQGGNTTEFRRMP